MALPKKIQDQRKDLVDKVVKDIEDGKPFFWDKGHYGKQPRNLLKAIKGEDKYYKGINAMQLAVAARVNGFKDSRWATFKQAEMAGGRVKKGAKGTHIEYWQYTQDVMENMIKNSEAKIFFDELSRNYYSSSKDEIHVIPREKFKNLDNFYATVAHEIAHSTGAEGRLNRETLKNNNGFGNEIYAKEELRAELTSMFLQQRYNVNFDEKHYENHAAYLQSWAQVIKNDPNEIYRAAADAEKAMSYIETRMINKNLTKDKEKSVQKEMTLENKAPKRIIKQKITMKIDTQKSKSKERTLTR